jgi:hypothetical protein
MFGIAVEYDAGIGGGAAPAMRAACRQLLAGRPGYRRRLALRGDGWRRVAAHPGCRNAASALLVSESQWGDPVVLLRGRSGATGGDQACWRDRLAHAEPGAVLW